MLYQLSYILFYLLLIKHKAIEPTIEKSKIIPIIINKKNFWLNKLIKIKLSFLSLNKNWEKQLISLLYLIYSKEKIPNDTQIFLFKKKKKKKTLKPIKNK